MPRKIGERHAVPLKTFKERLRDVISKAPSGRRAAELLDLAPATFNNAINLDKTLATETFALLHDVVGVNLNWLICGDGPTGNIEWPKDPIARTRRRPSVGARDSASMPTTRTSPPRKRG